MKTSNQIKTIVLFLLLFVMQSFWGQNTLRVMKTGLGDGTITSNVGGINCGANCNATYASATDVTLTAQATGGSVFLGWEGDVTSNSATVTVPVNQYRSMRAKFDLTTTIPEISDFTPEGIRDYLTRYPHVNTPGRFLKALPIEYKWNWVLMSRSESLQTGTAKIPRIILPSPDARFVFTIGLGSSTSYPGSHPNAIEYMQWDGEKNTFRMHEIVLSNINAMGAIPARNRQISIDDAKCSKCHSTRNVINRSDFPGTSPKDVIPFSKPNWDVYDSWAGMLPLNRDRIYKGSVEAAAFRKLFNLWTWQNNAPVREVLEQLYFQPTDPDNPEQPHPDVPREHVITRLSNGGINDGHIQYPFDGNAIVTTEPAPTGNPAVKINYRFDGVARADQGSDVIREGVFLTLHHSEIPDDDEGRGIRLFDALGGSAGELNPLRVAHEIINHKYATGSVPIDVRPIALAIIKKKVEVSANGRAVVSKVNGAPLNVTTNFFDSRILPIDQLVTDTRTRQISLTRRKADIQSINLDRIGDPYTMANVNGLVQEYGANTSFGTSDALSRIRQEVFRREPSFIERDQTVMGGFYADRESYSVNTEYLALFRYFLEPLGVSVDQWSTGVRSRSLGYNFADIFDNGFPFNKYQVVLERELTTSLEDNPINNPSAPGNFNPNVDSDLIAAVNYTLRNLPAVDHTPKYTDVQRIFNKACIECHGGLRYPPYESYFGRLDLSENENVDGVNGNDRLKRSHTNALSVTSTNIATSRLYQRLINTNQLVNSGGMMPMNGPPLSKADIETIKRWIEGTPSRPYTHGDPHIRTVNGVSYDFQAAGEFTLLTGQSVTLQARQTAVETARPFGPNAHTGLTSCVSINTAFAMRLGSNRITYQPSGMGVDGSEMQLRVDGRLINLTDSYPLNDGGRILRLDDSIIQIEGQGGTIIVITAGFWSSVKQWYLHIDIRHIRATSGVMGEITSGNWLPALPDGTELGPMPKSLEARHNVLYNQFGEAWRVHPENSLFDYSEGTSTNTFTLSSWPTFASDSCSVPNTIIPNEPQPIIDRATAEARCGAIRDDGRRENCIIDIITTGEVGFAATYIAADIIDRNRYPEPPKLTFPRDHDTIASLPFDFEWERAIDADGDLLNYRFYVWPVDEAVDNNKAKEVFKESFVTNYLCWIYVLILIIVLLIVWWIIARSNAKNKGAWKSVLVIIALAGIAIIWATCKGKTLTQSDSSLESGKAYFWKVIVEDGNGGTTESETYRFTIR
jgi:hypothetical protein